MSRILNTKKTRLAFGVSRSRHWRWSQRAFAYWTSSGEGTGTVKSNYAGASFEVSSGLVENLYPAAAPRSR